MGFFTVLAHEADEVLEKAVPLTEIVKANQINFTLFSVVLLIALTVLAILFNRFSKKAIVAAPIGQTIVPPVWKTILFIAMVLVILANSAYLVGSTLSVNAKSVTDGPVHWHADFEVWHCGQELELIDPKAPSNRVGSPLLHEHNDKKIHIEEAVFDWKDINLGAFFKVVEGDLHSDYLKFPTNEAVVEMRNGDFCPDGTPGTLQVFLYKAGSFTQQKLENPEDYLITKEQKVPPGDCLIFEFGPIREQTDKLCQSYQVAKEKQHDR